MHLVKMTGKHGGSAGGPMAVLCAVELGFGLYNEAH